MRPADVVPAPRRSLPRCFDGEVLEHLRQFMSGRSRSRVASTSWGWYQHHEDNSFDDPACTLSPLTLEEEHKRWDDHARSLPTPSLESPPSSTSSRPVDARRLFCSCHGCRSCRGRPPAPALTPSLAAPRWTPPLYFDFRENLWDFVSGRNRARVACTSWFLYRLFMDQRNWDHCGMSPLTDVSDDYQDDNGENTPYDDSDLDRGSDDTTTESGSSGR